MSNTGIRSNRPKASPRHRIANIQDELTSDLPELIRGRHLRPRSVSELHRQRTHRTTHTQSVEGTVRQSRQRHG